MHARDNVSGEMPVADAVEQDQDTAPEPAPPREETTPVRANTREWRDGIR